MSCFLCGHEKDGSHHLGCVAILKPDLTMGEAAVLGLIAPPDEPEEPAESVVEVVVEGKTDSVPVHAEMVTVGQCELDECDNPKYSDHPRVKYCEAHKDPKNRKE